MECFQSKRKIYDGFVCSLKRIIPDFQLILTNVLINCCFRGFFFFCIVNNDYNNKIILLSAKHLFYVSKKPPFAQKLLFFAGFEFNYCMIVSFQLMALIQIRGSFKR